MMSFWVMLDDSINTDELLAGAGAAPIQRFQSGVINGYVTWMVLGLAVIGGVLALIIC